MGEQMRILQLSEDFYPKTSGGAFEDWNFARLSAEQGHQVTVYTSRIADTPKQEHINNVEIRRPFHATPTNYHPNSFIGVCRRLLFLILFTIQLIRDLHSSQYDVIYSTNHLLHPTAKLIGLLYEIPVVNHVAYSPSERTEIHPLDFRNLFEHVIFSLFMGRIVLCRTPQVRDRIDNRSRSTVRLVHGLIEREAIAEAATAPADSARAELGMDDAESLVVCVCRFVPVKQPDEAVRVLSELPDAYRLALVGDGDSLPTIEQEVSARGVEDRVDLLGHRPHSETLEIIAAADYLILTSSAEAYPTVVFEALSLNTPVVSTPVGILPKIDHPSLWLSDLDSMAETVRNLDAESDATLDEDTAYRFSIERFTDSVLDTLAIATEMDGARE